MLVCGGWGWLVDGGWMPLSTGPQRYCNPREKMRMGERKRERKRERDGQTKNKQRNTCTEWNKPKRCPEKKNAINQTKHNRKKFQNLELTTFFLRRETPLLVIQSSSFYLVLVPWSMDVGGGSSGPSEWSYLRALSDSISRKQVTQGHNIIADSWAGVSNPQPHPNPPLAPHTQ